MGHRLVREGPKGKARSSSATVILVEQLGWELQTHRDGRGCCLLRVASQARQQGLLSPVLPRSS